uniref:Uncharacterized protein n=1 Tax=Pristionchus pacificus TaxID=54126 RepID=A0A2A6CUI5_PRIPA|eukprot:PDM81892.1 hypothetical protein PRIPAC_34046 [Pristionchus pacificus]
MPNFILRVEFIRYRELRFSANIHKYSSPRFHQFFSILNNSELLFIEEYFNFTANIPVRVERRLHAISDQTVVENDVEYIGTVKSKKPRNGNNEKKRL